MGATQAEEPSDKPVSQIDRITASAAQIMADDAEERDEKIARLKAAREARDGKA